MSSKTLSINDLCALADIPIRTLRFYVQKGLVDRPEGEKRGAFYTDRHLEQVLMIKRWSAAGLSLERIQDLLKGEPGDLPPLRRKPGEVRVSSHLYVSEGIEIVLDPALAGLSTEEVRAFARGVMELYTQIGGGSDRGSDGEENE